MRIHLIEDLVNGSIPPASYLLVEFDPTSQWYNASLTITSAWLKEGGRVSYSSFAQPPDDVRSQLNRLGLNVEELEKSDRLQIWDGYTGTLGQKSKEKYAYESLKAADLSIWVGKDFIKGPPTPELLQITDCLSVYDRFNEEKAWVEFMLARVIPARKLRKQTAIRGLMRGVHSDWAYRQLEAPADGVVDLKLEETAGGETQDLMRIRNMRNITFIRGWRPLKISENLEVTLDRAG